MKLETPIITRVYSIDKIIMLFPTAFAVEPYYIIHNDLTFQNFEGDNFENTKAFFIL